MDIDTDWLVDWGRRATDAELQTGMAVPEQWDPYFTSWMTRADVLEWAPKHHDHHRRQLTLAVASGVDTRKATVSVAEQGAPSGPWVHHQPLGRRGPCLL